MFIKTIIFINKIEKDIFYNSNLIYESNGYINRLNNYYIFNRIFEVYNNGLICSFKKEEFFKLNIVNDKLNWESKGYANSVDIDLMVPFIYCVDIVNDINFDIKYFNLNFNSESYRNVYLNIEEIINLNKKLLLNDNDNDIYYLKYLAEKFILLINEYSNSLINKLDINSLNSNFFIDNFLKNIKK